MVDATEPDSRDLVFGFGEDFKELNFQSISLILTAQQMAAEKNRAVWIAGLPPSYWRLLHSMRLSDRFRFFPQDQHHDIQ